MNLLFIGAHGLLGSHLVPSLKKLDGDGTLYPRVFLDAPKREKVDVTKPFKIPFAITEKKYDLIIHAAAYVDVQKAEIEKRECFTVNVQGTINLIDTFPEVPIVYISSEYAHNPVNYYSETKLAGETVVKALAKNYLIIRTLFKKSPFPYAKAFKDQMTQGDYVDVIAPMIAQQIVDWKFDNKTIYIGTGRKTMFDLAKRTRPDIESCSVKDVSGVRLPQDCE